MMLQPSFGVAPRVGPLWLKIEARVSADEARRARERRRLLPKFHRGRAAEVRWLRRRYALASIPALHWNIILAEVAAEFVIPVETIVGRSRRRIHLAPRFKAAWRLFAETDLSTVQIGERLGGRDPTTIQAAIDRYMHINWIRELPPHRQAGPHRLRPVGQAKQSP